MNHMFANHGCRADNQDVRGVCICVLGRLEKADSQNLKVGNCFYFYFFSKKM